MRKLLIVGIATLFAATAFAADIGGVKLADKMTVGGQELVLNGGAVRTKAIFKVYVGSLYLPAKAGDLAGVTSRRGTSSRSTSSTARPSSPSMAPRRGPFRARRSTAR